MLDLWEISFLSINNEEASYTDEHLSLVPLRTSREEFL